MQHFTENEKLFLKLIKKPCINAGLDNNILPSVIAVFSITLSSWGTGVHNGLTNNLFNLTVDDQWFGKCYSKDTQKIYNTKSECKEVGAILYKVYDNYTQSINDWARHIVTERRSPDGPLKYYKLVECIDYKDALYVITRNKSGRGDLDPGYITNLWRIIEKYKLYDWDDIYKLKKAEETDVSKKYKKPISVTTSNSDTKTQNETNNIQEQPVENAVQNEEISEEIESKAEENVSYVEDEETVYGFKMRMDDPIYRVRLEWERPDTQIFASQSAEDAVKEAEKHEGYIVFVGDDGEIYLDPWAKPEVEEVIDPDAIAVKDIVVPTAGSRVILDKTPIYKLSTGNKPFMYLSGNDFFYYNNEILNGRVRITKRRYTKNPKDILGFINI